MENLADSGAAESLLLFLLDVTLPVSERMTQLLAPPVKMRQEMMYLSGIMIVKMALTGRDGNRFFERTKF